jgi:uncharacterized protein (DUF2147 family)
VPGAEPAAQRGVLDIQSLKIGSAAAAARLSKTELERNGLRALYVQSHSRRKAATPMIHFLARPAALGLLAVVVAPALAAAPKQPTAAGLWQKVDQSGKPEGWFRIVECGDAYVGRIVKMFPKKGENLADWRCTQCRGDQKNSPVLGLAFIKGLRRNGLTYDGGSILDPRDGSIYNALLELSPDGKELTVRGYLGIPILGQSELWHRLPDSALAPDQFAACPAPSSTSR